MKTKKVPMRRCIGCMESRPKQELLRLVLTPEGNVMLDTTGKANGRGAYLCPKSECFTVARKKKAIGRALGGELSPEQLDTLFEELLAYEKKDS